MKENAIIKEQRNMQTLKIMQGEVNFLQDLIKTFEDEFRRLPEGYVCVNRIHGYNRYYHRIRRLNQSKYLKKTETDTLQALMRKRFIKQNLSVLRANAGHLSACIKNYKIYDPDAIINSLTEIFGQRASKAERETESMTMTAWEAAEHETNPYYEENKIHITPRGGRVRSKSEAMIAAYLYSKGIEYRYEASLLLEGKQLYPDFTIRRPSDGGIIYWEHFGLLRDEGYCRRAVEKVFHYMRNGIVPGENLIITCDDANGGINMETIAALVKGFVT